eukprot:5495256-Prymnesium_polylepis.1
MIWCPRHPPDSLATANASLFCAPVDARELLAALAIFTTAAVPKRRAILRATWFASSDDVVARFVLRGLGVRPELLQEATEHGDILFVEARSETSCKKGPLQKLVLWLACAVHAWPHAQYIGKGDDDVWIDLPGVAMLLRASHQQLRAEPPTWLATGANSSASRPETLIVWGLLEVFHWHTELHRPVGFSPRRFANHDCRLLQAPLEAVPHNV